MKKILTLSALIITSLASNIKAQHIMDNNNKLDCRQQSMVAISALTAVGNIEQLKGYLKIGMDAGLTVNEIKDELIQLYAYCGFPRSLNAINAFMVVLDERKAKGIHYPEGKTASAFNDKDKYQTGKKNLQQLTGTDEKYLTGVNAFAPAIDSYLKEHLFADIFSSDVLTFQQRELITVSALAALTGVEAQLEAHIGMGMNTGMTESQFKEAFIIIDQAVNKAQGDMARKTLDKVLDSKKQ
ncbi:carboxymuconolactone decarboxylase family protein [Flavobacterium psychrotrophum]|uniref:carboxymuconolactone decarboxylase family protein n=1 Tax=Flavobacterium psychrotrophum TaxID=2294119 RepID=UPI000E314B7B|nr:carboxymuconolactone decarboxylase family protein [Flavobacterium psychrotrophum]